MMVPGGHDIMSEEGTTQGDNLAMSFYALGNIPLLNALRSTSPNVSQVCLADDIAGAGKLITLRKMVGYHHNARIQIRLLCQPK